jgi:SPP1 gp7 family putative phage head morphogenesis protein
MYPLHLENQMARFIKKALGEKFKKLSQEILKAVKEDLVLPPNGFFVKVDSENFLIRKDSEETDRLLKEIRTGINISDNIRSGMVKNMATLDAWAKAQVNQTIDKQIGAMGNPPRRPGVISSSRPNFRVPALCLGESEAANISENLKNQIEKNFETVSELFKKHEDEVHNLVKESIQQGTSYKDLQNKIQEQTGVSERRAESWARDQSQRFVSEQESMRAKNAGFPGFYWRTQRDSRVRDTHRHYNGKELDGQYFTWDNLPVLNQQGTGMPGPLEPGKDYYCRCFKELGFPPDSDAKKINDDPLSQEKFNQVKSLDSKKEPNSGAFPKSRVLSEEKEAIKKYHSKIEKMTREERIRFIDSARFSTIDQTNLDLHLNEFKSRGEEVKSKFGIGLDEIANYVLKGKQYDHVAPYINQGAETIGFINQSLGIFIAVATNRKRIKTIYSVDEEWVDYFLSRNRVIL